MPASQGARARARAVPHATLADASRCPLLLLSSLPAIYGLYTDFLPLILFALFTSAMYLQVGAVAIVSLLTNDTVSRILQPQAAAVAALKSAASSASKAYAAQKTNPALAVLSLRATAAYNDANVSLIQTQIDTASLLAFYVGIFSFGIGFLKLGNIMNLMGPAVRGSRCC